MSKWRSGKSPAVGSLAPCVVRVLAKASVKFSLYSQLRVFYVSLFASAKHHPRGSGGYLAVFTCISSLPRSTSRISLTTHPTQSRTTSGRVVSSIISVLAWWRRPPIRSSGVGGCINGCQKGFLREVAVALRGLELGMPQNFGHLVDRPSGVHHYSWLHIMAKGMDADILQPCFCLDRIKEFLRIDDVSTRSSTGKDAGIVVGSEFFQIYQYRQVLTRTRKGTVIKWVSFYMTSLNRTNKYGGQG